MPKEKIAIISILKPIDDIRSYEKFAQTLSSIDTYELHLFGQSSLQKTDDLDGVKFHPHKAQPQGIFRILTRLEVLIQLIKLKPQLIICNTHELLIVTVINKILFGCKILYDIQENYNFNILHQGHYPKIFRRILAWSVRLKEAILSPIFDHFILAEKSYQDEILFVKDKFTVIENKVIVPKGWQKKISERGKTRMLFSGTLTKSNGILKALSFFKSIHHTSIDFEFCVIGHCPERSVLKTCESEEFSFIEWHISRTPVPHQLILEQIKKADFGLIGYNLNPSNQNCMPTKVFEYIGLGLPCLYEVGGLWSKFIIEHNAGICIDYKIDIQSVLIDQIKNYHYNSERSSVSNALWLAESDRLIHLINEILHGASRN